MHDAKNGCKVMVAKSKTDAKRMHGNYKKGPEMKQFTDRYLASIKPQEKKFTVREGRGFALQILPSGIKSFLFIFELNKQKGYMKIGNYPSMSLSDARKAYNDAYNLVKSGVDPREDKKAALEESRRKAEELVQSTAALEKTPLNSSWTKVFLKISFRQQLNNSSQSTM